MFVQFVDRRVARAEFDDLCADVGDKPAVRGAAGGRELRFDAGDFDDGGVHGIGQFRLGCEKRFARQFPLQVIVQTMFAKNFIHAVLERFDRAGGGETEVE